jgi:hypothetical protein
LGFPTGNKQSKRDKKGSIKYSMRPLCKCGRRPAAVNYYKEGKPYYRKLCEACLKGNSSNPRWQRSGYVMKNTCDKCGFKSPYPEVFAVFHVDGDLNNCKLTNLKTVCANCQRTLHRDGAKWRQGDLVPDL